MRMMRRTSPGHPSFLPKLPQRQRLPHVPPDWVKETSLFFITFCTVPRGLNQLCRPSIGLALLASAQLYHDRGRWWAKCFLLMPDHVHALMAFPREQSMPDVIMQWKGYQTKSHGLKWQAGFFDHRLRSGESEQQKADYIRQNPVRAGLVGTAEDWPFVWPRTFSARPEDSPYL
jgi:REP element-mobilizing transposase RayT